MTKAQELALANKRKRFGRAVKAGHAMRASAKANDLKARNAYRVAVGLPPVTLAK